MPICQVFPAKDGAECYDCGDPAVETWVADGTERDTGYSDELDLCAACAYLRVKGLGS